MNVRVPRRHPRLAALLVIAGSVWVATPAAGGPPLICFPYEIGDAKSLPWGGGTHDKSSGYDRKAVVKDTLDLLKTEKDTLVRMETLRRATIYVKDDRALATELLAKFAFMALDAEAADNETWAATALFDAGFLAACYHQHGVDIGWKPGVEDRLQGWAWMSKGLEYDGSDPARQYAAALVLQEKNDGSYKPYLVRALQGTEQGSNLAKSIESNGVFGSKKLEELRESLGVADARRSGTGR